MAYFHYLLLNPAALYTAVLFFFHGCLDSISLIQLNYVLFGVTSFLKHIYMAQWLERGGLPMSLPAVRFRIPLGAGFSEKYHVSPLSILGHC